MNFVAFLFLFSAFVAIQGATIYNNPEEEARRSTACQRRYSLNRETIKRVNSGVFDNDPNLKEYLLCINKVAGFQDEAGDIQKEVIMLRLRGGYYSFDTIDEVLERCTDQKRTPQETAYHLMRCIYKITRRSLIRS